MSNISIKIMKRTWGMKRNINAVCKIEQLLNAQNKLRLEMRN